MYRMIPMADLYRIQGYDQYNWSWTSLVTMFVGALMFILATWQMCVYGRKWYKKPTNSQNRLWATLVKHHRLSRQESQLLSKLAKTLPSTIPVTCVFIDPSLWDDDSKLPSSDLKSTIKQKLFGPSAMS
jgi:hypothetical protein